MRISTMKWQAVSVIASSPNGLAREEAAALVRFRDASGPFKNWDDLIKAPGLDVKKIEGKKGALTF